MVWVMLLVAMISPQIKNQALICSEDAWLLVMLRAGMVAGTSPRNPGTWEILDHFLFGCDFTVSFAQYHNNT